MSRATYISLIGAALATTVACGPAGSPPELDALPDQVATVGRELVIEIRATDEDGDELEFDFSSVVPDIQSRAQMTKRPDGSGLFRWTPQASDVNPGWAFDFTVTDGSDTDTVTIQIEVKSDVGQAGAPIFREPLGTGTTLDLNVNDCIDVDIVITDADTAAVTLTEEEPRIPGARLSSASNGLSGTWTWCPTREQIDEDDRWTLTLSADDGSNERTMKRYLIVLRKPPKEDCPGNPPVITHSPQDEDTILNLSVFADVTDDAGLKAEPLFYYSTTPPASPPDLSQMTQVSMVLLDGDMRNGSWGADVPNPVVGMPAGARATVHYVIVATDNDDVDGSCDHLTQAPTSGAFSMTVTNPGGAGGGAGVCAPCTNDLQCGGAADSCVRVGDMADSFCLKACSGPSDCPTDYSCSASPVESVNGVSSRQCVPNSSSCEDPGGGVCIDDAFEDNDNRTQATANPILPPGTHNAVSCEEGAFSDDEDFYRIQVTADSQVSVSINGGSQSDLDLALQREDGTLVKSSTSLTSMESVSECLEPGTYFIRVYAFSAEHNPYTLTYSRTAMSCGGAICSDDELEPNDNQAQATEAAVFPNPFLAETMAMCSEDDDWFEIELFTDETVYVDLTFEQASVSEDLDLHFHDAAGVDLTPCEEDNPITCSSAQGQSASSNEHFERVITEAGCAPCTFYVRVHGWNGAENLYDLRIGLEPVAP